MTELEALRAFAQEVLECWPLYELDGMDLQEVAVKHGMLAATQPTAPCGENCACADYYAPEDWAEGAVICYRRTALLNGGGALPRESS